MANLTDNIFYNHKKQRPLFFKRNNHLENNKDLLVGMTRYLWFDTEVVLDPTPSHERREADLHRR
jgi:hypothetical protein